MRVPSGATAAPWLTSMPLMIPTTLFVTGSITCTLSPALLVWMIRTFRSAVFTATVHTRTPTATARNGRNR